MTGAGVKDRDGLLAALAASCALASALLTFSPRPTPGDDQSSSAGIIARVSAATAELRRRPEKTLGWYEAPVGTEVNEHDALFVPPGGDAQITFTDGSVLELDERTLVVVDVPAGARGIALRQGSFTGSAGKLGLDVVTPQGTAHLPSDTSARVEVTATGAVEVDVEKGMASVGGANLEAGARGALRSGSLQSRSPWPVTLVAPAANHRRFFRGAAPALTLQWKGELPRLSRLQVARDRLFSFVVVDTQASSLAHTLDEGGAGVFWWRVLDANGRPLSEARRFSVLEDTSPIALTPREGEVVTASATDAATFAWTRVRGVSRYRLEVSADPGFGAVAFSSTVDATLLKTALPLAEGVWHWRVRVADEERGDCEPAPGVSFRLIHKPIPEVPQLLAPEIEVDRGQPK